jgi:hypothetical protein
MPSRGRACLTCKHVHFIVPADWKPSYSGEEYNSYAVIKVIRDAKGRHVSARCTFDPVWIDVTTGHYCGRWDGLLREETVSDVLWGTWAVRQNNELHEKIKELKRLLQKSRSISAGRLARLKSSGDA